METAIHERRVQTICLLGLTAMALGAALYFLRPVLIPFAVAVFLMYSLTPIIDVQMRYLRLSRMFAVINTILLGCLGLILLWLLIGASVNQMAANADHYEAQFLKLVDDVTGRLPVGALGLDGDESLLALTRDATRHVLSTSVSSIMGFLSTGLLVIIFLIFLMAGHRGVTPPGGFREAVESRIKRYAVTKIVVSATTGILVGLTLLVLGVEMAFVFGMLAFLLNFIPNIGSVIATLLPVPVVLLSPDLSVVGKVLAIALPGCIQFAVGNLLEPKIMGDFLDLHPVVILLGLIFFGMIWGITGMFLATPIVAVIKIVVERIDMIAPVGSLLAGRLDAQGPPAQS